MKELFSKHPNLIKFTMFSVVILLLLLMLAIRTEKQPGANAGDAQAAASDGEPTAEALDEQHKQLENAMSDENSSKETTTGEVDDLESTPTPTPEPEIELEAFDLLETDFAQLEETLGTGIPEGRPNERYFMAPGASIRYDHDSELINKITIDGDGDNRASMSLLGIKLGDDFDKSQDILTEQGINIIDLQENTYMCEFYLGNDKKKVYQIFITGEEGKVSEMQVSIK